MKTRVLSLIILICMIILSGSSAAGQGAPAPLNCDFNLSPPSACIQQEVNVVYTGGNSPSATYIWNFDSAVVISGSGQGPYVVKWETPGEKHLSLTINWESQTCTNYRTIIIHEKPAVFNVTGGGNVPPAVAVGLDGSQSGIIYMLYRDGTWLQQMVGTGSAISFGLFETPGIYTVKARIDGSYCIVEMDGHALINGSTPPPATHICMVTYDTTEHHNRLIWFKQPLSGMSHYNVYREGYQNNVFDKIAEVSYTNLSTFVDTTSDPIIKSDRYKISLVNNDGVESEKSPYHKTIHLNISPGIYGFNLIWNHYEGFEFKTYKIHRKYWNEPWTVIDSVASNVDSYTDSYTTSGLATYYIEVVRYAPCIPTLKTGETMSAFSNYATSAPLGIEQDRLTGIMIYPNPVRDRLVVTVPDGNATVYQMQIFCPDGRKVLEENIRASRSEFELSNLPGGLYILKIESENVLFVRKFFKR